MMRSLFSGVAGLRTHQTRMDVIGNNIANVNTTAYKSQNMVFSDLLYQTTQAASGANDNGRGGINARQIGLGAKTGAISTAITTQGSAQSTNNPWDIMIEGDSFFIVNNGSENFFTRDGSFTIDGAGNLVMANTGFKVMGWQVDPETGDIRQDVVSALQVMHPDNLNSNPEATSLAYVSGILDKTDTSINSTAGAIRTFQIFDAQGYAYTVKMSFHGIGSEDEFRVQLDDILDSTGVSLVKKYNLSNINQIANFGGDNTTSKTMLYQADNTATFDGTSKFDIELPFSSILDGYSNNALVVAAGKNVTITNPGDGGTVTAGAENSVTVHGSVTLTRAQLESAPYNLRYDDATGQYYTKPETGTTGVPVTDWTTAISAMGLEGVSNVTVTPVTDGAAGEMSVEFDATFTPTLDATRKDNVFGITLEMPNDEKEILKQVYHVEDGDGKTYTIEYIAPDGSAQITERTQTNGMSLVFDHDTGVFSYIGSAGSNTATLTFNSSASSLGGELIDLTQFNNVEIDFSSVTNYGNGGKCTLDITPGGKGGDTIGKGRAPGELIGIEVGQDGRITASYSNGLSKLLGQIAVAEFANPSGLSKAGDNLYSATMNSGDFDGVGKDITESGGKMTSGVLEMSNVDLSSEFTTMITTQRGFQANSRIITTSDTLLEELVNLKR
ncbi:MAG: flagellar hook-basal body complex protein [Lachnospiraceae bacterium]|nr:flagellar hook-basal body complex protein [Lachnospiraceae bacterium]